jgi:hypothetical protein
MVLFVTAFRHHLSRRWHRKAVRRLQTISFKVLLVIVTGAAVSCGALTSNLGCDRAPRRYSNMYVAVPRQRIRFSDAVCAFGPHNRSSIAPMSFLESNSDDGKRYAQLDLRPNCKFTQVARSLQAPVEAWRISGVGYSEGPYFVITCVCEASPLSLTQTQLTRLRFPIGPGP